MNWIVQPPSIVRWIFPKSIWRLSPTKGEKIIALTFDDGPVPEQTPWVLDMLDKHEIKATFFCVGDNVRKYPEIFDEIVRRGHTVGNHTFNHLQLLKTPWKQYSENIDKCVEAEKGLAPYFRAPHGHITPWKAYSITHDKGFCGIVFWDVMPKDYDNRLTPEEVYANVRKYVRNGSIIVLHDSIKAGERMRYTLEKTIETYKAEGYKFVAL